MTGYIAWGTCSAMCGAAAHYTLSYCGDVDGSTVIDATLCVQYVSKARGTAGHAFSK